MEYFTYFETDSYSRSCNRILMRGEELKGLFMCTGSGILNVANFVSIPKAFSVTNLK